MDECVFVYMQWDERIQRQITACHSIFAFVSAHSINMKRLSAAYFRKIKQAYGKDALQGRGVHEFMCVCVYNICLTQMQKCYKHLK